MDIRSLPSLPPPPARAAALTIISLIVTLALAGCTEQDDGVDMEAFQDAMEAPGETYTPDENDGDTDFRVKLLNPVDPDQARTGLRPLSLLVYDASSEQPITDVTFQLESWMNTNPEGERMDHGTDREKAPEHQAGGVYHGTTHHFMAGQWETRLDGVRPNGDAFHLVIDYEASQDS